MQHHGDIDYTADHMPGCIFGPEPHPGHPCGALRPGELHLTLLDGFRPGNSAWVCAENTLTYDGVGICAPGLKVHSPLCGWYGQV